MSQFVSNCPRCGAENTTFDCYVSAWAGVEYNWKNYAEIFAICRRCHRSSIQLVSQQTSDDAVATMFRGTTKLAEYIGTINDLAKFEQFITLKDNHNFKAPDHLPENIRAIIDEANSCLASQCFNAAGAMYRLALDIATKNLLPENEDEGPPAKIRRSLGLRMGWLFDNDKIPTDLKALADCLQQDGNDGAHDGTLRKIDAEDLQDFCFELLRRLFTEPERLRMANKRRAERRRTS